MSKIGGRAAHFLSQKPWTPWNPQTQKQIWEAEQKAKEVDNRERERAEQIKRQADLESQAKLVTFLGSDHQAIGSTAGEYLLLWCGGRSTMFVGSTNWLFAQSRL